MFNGVRDGFAVLDFLERMKLFFIGARIAEEDRTITALGFAGSETIQWWNLLEHPLNAPFLQFSSLMATEFSPANFKEHILSLVMNLRMTGPFTHLNLMAYVNTSRRYYTILLNHYTALTNNASASSAILDDAVRTAFLAGVPANLRQSLELKIVSNVSYPLLNLFHDADVFGRILATTVNNVATPTPLIASSSSDPNAMEIDNLRLEINSLRRQIQRQGNRNNTNQGNSNGAPGRLTDREREQLRRTDGCYRCRKPGHYSQECTAFNSVRAMQAPEANSQPGKGSDGSA